MASKITFLLSGEQQQSTATRGGGGAAAGPAAALVPGLGGEVKATVRLGARRSGGEAALVRLEAEPGLDIVILQLLNGPALVLHPETARDLLLAQSAEPLPEKLPDEIPLPDQLQWQALEQVAASPGGGADDLPGGKRGFVDKAIAGAVGKALGAGSGLFGKVVVQAVQVITGRVQERAADFAASKVVQGVDGLVANAVYALNPLAIQRLKGSAEPLKQVPKADDDGPLLVLLHGTFTNTSTTFHDLWDSHPERVKQLFAHYKQRVYGFDHPTLGESPIENALTLASTLPAGARLHLLTHSRGGLVGEVLARVCAEPEISAAALALFKNEGQRKALKALGEVVKAKGLRVDRMLRVACPARGTLLASSRLDAYVSVVTWAMQLAGIPVGPELIGFLGAVAQRRKNDEIVPGLEAQMPGSALITWLHAADKPLPGQLRVIAGDLETDSITSWLKTLLADSFFWTDNDLIVQTSSMYGGAARKLDASYLLAVGGTVSHFKYFENELTAEGVTQGLIEDKPQRFQRIGPLSAAGLAAEGLRGNQGQGPGDGRPASSKPAVFVLPGILGSNLAVGDERIWLGLKLINGLKRLEYKAGDKVRPDGPVGLSYDRLIDFLGASHDVVPFGFDWRKPLAEEARRLATAVEAKLDERKANGQPVRLIAHSMGGLLARTMQIECPATWDRLMAHREARLLMLGTPNAGSWAPMQVLSGDDTFGNFLVDFGAPLQDSSARHMMAQFPGFIQLQADLLDPQLKLDQEATWARLAADDLQKVRDHNFWHLDDGRQLNVYQWGVPRQAVLNQAVELRRKLDEQRSKALPGFADKLRLVVGKAAFTPAGYLQGPEGLSYMNAAAGDGRVTLDSAMLPGVRAWKLDCEHGELANLKTAFPAYLEILQTGTTSALIAQPPLAGGASRGAGEGGAAAQPLVLSRPARMRKGARPPASPADAQRLMPDSSPARRPAADAALRLSVLNGDLKFIRQPLLLGHYRSLTLTGTEFAIDRLIGGTMQESLAIGRYPDLPGTLQIFANTGACPSNPLQMPRPAAVIVVGLGPEGALRGSDLVYTVRQGAIAWAQKTFEQGVSPQGFELAATLIGSGGAGVSAGQAAQWIAQGVVEANQRLADRRHNPRGWPPVGHLLLIEQYLDRASEAWRALRAQAVAEPDNFCVADAVTPVVGALRRPPDSGYRGASYDLISAFAVADASCRTSIAYTLDTKRARSEMRAQQTQGPLVRELVRQGSNDGNQDPQIGRTLFNLLVPPELGGYLSGTTEMLIELNPGSAGIPWEILDTREPGRVGGDQRPWAIRAKLLRKLRLEGFRPQVRDAGADDAVLVVGEPQVTAPGYLRLPGARLEAQVVAATLADPAALGPLLVHALIAPDDEAQPGPDAASVINRLMARDWRIVHIAGHGEAPLLDDPRGVVLSGGIFLGSREIEALRVVPELVFINCCHLGARNPGQLLMADDAPQRDRAQFAASVAEALIRIGVRCVVAAGWAVEDAAAMRFAGTFYRALMNGRRFMDAVALAREDAERLGGNTWAAYQCYGDPDWRLRRGGSDAQTATPKPPPTPAEEFAGIASAPGLALALETLGVQCSFDDAAPAQKVAGEEAARARLRYLALRFGPKWGAEGAVAEAFGYAWNAAGDRPTAITWYRRAVAAADGLASFKSMEQLGNLLVREAEAGVKAAGKLAGAGRNEPLKAARALLDEGFALLAPLAALQPTMERLALLGSAHKRLAMSAGPFKLGAAELQKAIEQTAFFYTEAERLGRRDGLDFFYPAMNALVARLARGRREIDPARLAELRQVLAIRTQDEPDFWSVAGLTELDFFEALAQERLNASKAAILAGFASLRSRVSSTWMWDSVFKQAEFLRAHAMPEAASKASERAAADAIVAALAGYATGAKG